MKKILLKLFVRWYTGQTEPIVKISPKEQIKQYFFGKDVDMINLLKAEITSKMNKYYLAKNDYERAIVKGGIIALKILKEKHALALELSNLPDEDLKIKKWVSTFK